MPLDRSRSFGASDDYDNAQYFSIRLFYNFTGLTAADTQTFLRIIIL